jgi:hypothetical protein
MPESVQLAKAELRQLDADFKNEIKPEHNAKVQFNPETLKVSFANQIATPDGAGDQKGTPARQFVGAGTTKLTLQLWFDVTAEVPAGVEKVADVRKLTQKVAYFITPTPEGKNFVPPAVRFIWGSFQFDGLMESLEESLEFFSPDGIPLRASMSLSLTQQKITVFSFAKDAGAPPPGAGESRGTRPLTAAPAGSTLQGLAAARGRGNDWQAIATANNIENPRLLQPGQLIDMDAKAPAVSAGVGSASPVSASLSIAGPSLTTQQTGTTRQVDAALQAGR